MMVIHSSPSAAREPVVLRDITAMFRRRAGWIVVFSIAGLGAGAALYGYQPRLYRAEAVLALDVRRIQGMPIDQVVAPLPQENPVLRTELDMIGSRVMAQRVLASLAAAGVDPFAPASKPAKGDGGEGGQEDLGAEASPVPVDRTTGHAGNPGDTDSLREDRLREGLKVVNDGRSYTIYIAYTARDPEVAALVANTYARAYLAYQDDVQIDATRRVSGWLSAQLKVLAARLEQSEQEAERHRASSGLQEIDGVTLMAQRLTALNAELMAARAAHATAEARERTATRLASQTQGLDSFSEVLGSPIIQQLRANQAEMGRRLRVLKDTGAVQSAHVPALTSELDAVRLQIAQEVAHILVSLGNEIEVAAQRVAALERELSVAQANHGASDLARVKLDALVREANADRAVYESLLGRSKQIVDQNGLVDPGVRLISEATAPNRRFGLRLLPSMLMGFLAGLSAGMALALLLERLDDRVRSRRALEAVTGIPVLATIPILPWRRRADRFRHHATCTPFGEAMASLQWMLRLSPTTRRASVLMVTSALPGEGKTTVALAIARSMATAGRSVVLVDADLRRQSLGRMIRSASTGEKSRGLGAFLDGEVDIDDILSADPSSPLRIIAATEPGKEVQEQLGSPRMKQLIEALRDRFDLVILDLPPVLTSSDAAQIGEHADAILCVARWGNTTHEAVLSALQKLALCGLQVSAFVLNRVERRAHQSYEAARVINHPAAPGFAVSRLDEAMATSLAQRKEG